jgi:hypothetical protein
MITRNNMICLKNIVLVMMLLIASEALAQNPQSAKLKWEASQFTDDSNTTINHATAVITNPGSQQFQWIQKGGAKVYTYSITAVEGTWTDLSTDGQLTLSLSTGGQTATALLKRTTGVYSIVLTIQADNETNAYTFPITNITITE